MPKGKEEIKTKQKNNVSYSIGRLTATERREEIMNRMIIRRKDTIENLAHEFGVSRRTIERDIEYLETRYPIKACQGKYGGVYVEEWYHPFKNTLSIEEALVLRDLCERATEKERRIIEGILREHSRYDPDKI